MILQYKILTASSCNELNIKIVQLMESNPNWQPYKMFRRIRPTGLWAQAMALMSEETSK